MEAKLGIDKENIKGSTKLLSVLLADETVLYIKALNFHWNVRGFHFGSLHKLFKKQYEGLAEWIDMIAERIRMLGEYAPGSMKEFLELTRLDEHKGGCTTEKGMLSSLLADHEAIIRLLRVDIEVAADRYKDIGTSDYFTELLRNHEQMAWILRVHLESNDKC
jgi:starvation-inducible DNA-binding protein